MNKHLFNALFKSPTHYYSVLPYNLNWGIKLPLAVKEYLTKHPVIIADIGCRGGATDELEVFAGVSKMWAFDADRKECDRLEGMPHPYMDRRVFPYFVGGKNGNSRFKLYNPRTASSVFDPDARFCRLFMNQGFEVEKTVDVETTTLDDIFQTENLEKPDFLKLDTQGSELDILKSASGVLEKTALVEVEVEFTAMYANQPLFFHVAEFMYSKGFELLYLNRVFQQRSASYAGLAKGQLTFGDALFARREDRLKEMETDRLVKYALLLIHFGHVDIAYGLTQDFPSIKMVLPAIDSFFYDQAKRTFAARVSGRIGRTLRPSLDKLILLLLHLRGSNHLTFDSDRNWPFR